MTALIAFLTDVLTLLIYTAYIVIKYGVQKSFSDSYYALEADRKGKGKLFGITMITMTFCFAIAMLDFTAGYWWQFVGFLAIAPIGFVGVAAAFREAALPKKCTWLLQRCQRFYRLHGWSLWASTSPQWLIYPFPSR